MKMIEVQTQRKEEFIDLTPKIQQAVSSGGVAEGVCLVYVPHTTAGLTINEHADPDVTEDLLMALKRLVPDSLSYKHSEGNSPAHVKASLLGSSVQIVIENGKMALGTWQGVFLGEFDGPRKRKVYVQFMG